MLRGLVNRKITFFLGIRKAQSRKYKLFLRPSFQSCSLPVVSCPDGGRKRPFEKNFFGKISRLGVFFIRLRPHTRRSVGSPFSAPCAALFFCVILYVEFLRHTLHFVTHRTEITCGRPLWKQHGNRRKELVTLFDISWPTGEQRKNVCLNLRNLNADSWPIKGIEKKQVLPLESLMIRAGAFLSGKAAQGLLDR